jgi:hypothetical protein
MGSCVHQPAADVDRDMADIMCDLFVFGRLLRDFSASTRELSARQCGGVRQLVLRRTH